LVNAILIKETIPEPLFAAKQATQQHRTATQLLAA
jgi:hypothetical protein